jgi:tetratricopeptide (TPR) repeat protein
MKYLGVGWLWFIGTLVPVIGLVQIGAQSMADRYAYIPLVGIFILLVWGVSELIERYRRARDYVIIGGVCALLGLIIATRMQLGYWADSLTLWDHARHVTENNDIAYNNLGETIAMRGDLAEAAPFFFKALEINPELVTAQENVGTVLIQRGQIDEAIAHYKRAIDLDSTAFGAYNKLGSALGSKGQLDESIRCLEMALKINPGYAPAMANLGVALVNQGKLDQASVWFERAVQFTTDKDMATQCHFMYGNLLMEQGEPARAAVEYKAALSLEPDFSAAAEALSKTGRTGN